MKLVTIQKSLKMMELMGQEIDGISILIHIIAFLKSPHLLPVPVGYSEIVSVVIDQWSVVTMFLVQEMTIDGYGHDWGKRAWPMASTLMTGVSG